MNLAHKASKIVITGKSGTGKSTYLSRYVLNSFKTVYSNVLVFDHNGEFSYRWQIPACLTCEDLERSLQSGMTIFDPSEMYPGDTEIAWNFFCEWSFEFATLNVESGKKLLVCDEMQIMASTAEMPHELATVIETGRKYTLDFVGVSQQLNLLHNRMRNQMTELVSFQQTDELVLKVLAEKGFDIEKVKRLQAGEFILRNFANGEERFGRINLGQNSVDEEEYQTESQTVAEDSESRSSDDEQEESEADS